MPNENKKLSAEEIIKQAQKIQLNMYEQKPLTDAEFGLFVDNILIHKYKSMSEASKQTGVLVTSISNNILGISKSTMLGVWKKL